MLRRWHGSYGGTRESGEGAWEGLESRALRTLQAILRNLSFTLSNTEGPLQTFEQRTGTP